MNESFPTIENDAEKEKQIETLKAHGEAIISAYSESPNSPYNSYMHDQMQEAFSDWHIEECLDDYGFDELSNNPGLILDNWNDKHGEDWQEKNKDTYFKKAG